LELEEEDDELCRAIGEMESAKLHQAAGGGERRAALGLRGGGACRAACAGLPRRWRAPLVGGAVALGGRRSGPEPGATTCRHLIHPGKEEVR
jgi:hypothetical protein